MLTLSFICSCWIFAANFQRFSNFSMCYLFLVVNSTGKWKYENLSHLELKRGIINFTQTDGMDTKTLVIDNETEMIKVS